MKKRIFSLLLVCIMTCSFLSHSILVSGLEPDLSDNVADVNDDGVSESQPDGGRSWDIPDFDIPVLPDTGILLADQEHSANSYSVRSADSITQQFSGYLTEESQYLYVPLTLSEQQIVHATLECPVKANLDYLLAIGTVEDGSISIFKANNIATYIDPNTGKTLDESLSFIHNQASPQSYAIVVMSASGSSSVDAFNLTISIDNASNYDVNEPNDSPADATILNWTASDSTQFSTTASLNVANDQDWYAIQAPDDGVCKLTAGDYSVDVFQFDAETKCIYLSTRSPSGNYVLEKDKVYFVKVYSDSPVDEFEFGNYTLSIEDQRKYTSMRTACDYGYWLYHSYSASIPWGQREAYYKFTIRDGEGVYSKVYVPTDGTTVFLSALRSNNTVIDSARSDFSGDVISSNGSTGFIAVNIDAGDVTDGVVYLHVEYQNPNAQHSNPSVSKRLYKGYGTFDFSGTCTNSGNSVSNTISLNLTNSSKIPARAIVYDIKTKGSLNPGVGGVYHMVQPGNMGWAMSGSASAGTGTYPEIDESYGIEAKQIWQFRYVQDAYASTKMTKISITLSWIQDIQFTNYTYQA